MSEFVFAEELEVYEWIQPYISDRKPRCQYDYMHDFYYDCVDVIELVCKDLWFDKLAVIPTDRIV